eukprot:6183212-Pleurochrysis_carterae.AAC.5
MVSITCALSSVQALRQSLCKLSKALRRRFRRRRRRLKPPPRGRTCAPKAGAQTPVRACCAIRSQTRWKTATGALIGVTSAAAASSPPQTGLWRPNDAALACALRARQASWRRARLRSRGTARRRKRRPETSRARRREGPQELSRRA